MLTSVAFLARCGHIKFPTKKHFRSFRFPRPPLPTYGTYTPIPPTASHLPPVDEAYQARLAHVIEVVPGINIRHVRHRNVIAAHGWRRRRCRTTTLRVFAHRFVCVCVTFRRRLRTGAHRTPLGQQTWSPLPPPKPIRLSWQSVATCVWRFFEVVGCGVAWFHSYHAMGQEAVVTQKIRHRQHQKAPMGSHSVWLYFPAIGCAAQVGASWCWLAAHTTLKRNASTNCTQHLCVIVHITSSRCLRFVGQDAQVFIQLYHTRHLTSCLSQRVLALCRRAFGMLAGTLYAYMSCYLMMTG